MLVVGGPWASLVLRLVWTEAWADFVRAGARWMARGATPQAHVFIYGLECVLWVCFSLRYSSRPFG